MDVFEHPFGSTFGGFTVPRELSQERLAKMIQIPNGTSGGTLLLLRFLTVSAYYYKKKT